MHRLGTAITAVAVLTASAASAQSHISWSAGVAPGKLRSLYFPMGTPIALATRTPLSTKHNHRGDRVDLEVMQPLIYDGEVIVPAGTLAVGEVAEFQRNDHLGVKGKLGVRLLHIDTPYGPIRIGGMVRGEGTSGTALSVGTMMFVSILGGFLIHGTSATLPVGTGVSAMLMEDLRFTPGIAAPAAMLASTPAAASTPVR